MRGATLKNELTEKRIVEALTKEQGKPPRKMELGGGFYYKCFWMACDENVNKFYEYCPKCGTKILWDDQ